MFDLLSSQEITSNPQLSEEEAAKLIAIKMEQSKKKNYGYYRVGALRSIGGGRKVGPNVPDKLKPVRIGLILGLKMVLKWA